MKCIFIAGLVGLMMIGALKADLPILDDPPSYIKKHPITLDQLVGTWKFVSVDGRDVPAFYTRYYVNSTAASWPAPANWTNVKNGVSRGKFGVVNGYMILLNGVDNPKILMTIKDNYLIGITSDGDTLYYLRIPNRVPGDVK